MKNASPNDVVPFVKNLCLTFSHLSYYPSTHPVSIKQMQEAWNELEPLLEKFPELSLSMVDDKLLFLGMPVEDRNPAALKFAKHFELLRIRGIKFRHGLDYDEFADFFTFLCKDTQAIIDAGGVDGILKEKNIRHIIFSKSVYREIGEEDRLDKKDENRSAKKSSVSDASKPQRKISKSFSPISVRIQNKLDADFKEIKDADRLKLMDYLNNVFVRETKKFEEKINELQAEIDDIRHIIQNVEDVFDDTNLGFILIDRDQKVCFIEHGNIIPYELMLNEPLPKDFLDKIDGFQDSVPLKIDNMTVMQITRYSNSHIKGILFQFE